jgi:hypothetical protein
MYCTESKEKVKVAGSFFTGRAMYIFIERMYVVDWKVGLKGIFVTADVRR